MNNSHFILKTEGTQPSAIIKKTDVEAMKSTIRKAIEEESGDIVYEITGVEDIELDKFQSEYQITVRQGATKIQYVLIPAWEY